MSEGGPWAARVPVAEVSAVAAVRLAGGIRACVVGGELWLRGEEAGEAVERALDRIAPAGRYAVREDGALVARGRLLPKGFLPAGAEWVPLAELVRPVVESAGLPGVVTARVGLTLVRSGEERVANVLVTTLGAFAEYAEGAPAVRLARLRFACDGERVVICGEPLPPLPGERLAEVAGVAAPCGYAWRPAVDASSLRRVLGVAEGDLALLAVDGSWQRIAATSFVRARRSAVRFTARGAAAGVGDE